MVRLLGARRGSQKCWLCALTTLVGCCGNWLPGHLSCVTTCGSYCAGQGTVLCIWRMCFVEHLDCPALFRGLSWLTRTRSPDGMLRARSRKIFMLRRTANCWDGFRSRCHLYLTL